MPHLFCFGLGYSALTLAHRLLAKGWEVSGTCRTQGKCDALAGYGIAASPFSSCVLPATVTHVLLSIPPDEQGDPILRTYGEVLRTLPELVWVGYLSTTGVYGDHQGEWVDETTPVTPPNHRSVLRAEAEVAWCVTGLPVHIFRLSGIYGPGRSAIESVQHGTARRIDKPGQVFSRIHVEDIATILAASIAKPHPGSIYNCADDEPCPQEQVVAYAARLLGMEPPPLVPFEHAELSPMARSFYGSNRRVGNAKIKQELNVSLRYPTYREGLAAINSL